MERVCKAEGCGRTDVKAKGYCAKHYERMRRNGNLELKRLFRGPKRYHQREYRIWEEINSRCYQIYNHSYPRYGAKGIKVCDRWRGPYGFENFIKDMGDSPGPEYFIDRMDIYRDYTPDNCEWVTRIEQVYNRNNRNAPAPGINYDKKSKKWKARYMVRGKRLSRSFSTKDEAIAQRIEWLTKYPR